MIIIIVVCIIIFIIFFKYKKNKDAITESKQTGAEKKTRIVEPFYFEVEKQSLSDLTEKQYDSLYNRFDNACEKYQDAVADVEAEFTMNTFNYETRVQSLKNAIKEFDKCFKLVAPFWYEDSWFMEMLELTQPNKWTSHESGLSNPNDVLEIDESPEKYIYTNINFLKWILKEYQARKEELIPLLEEKNNK